MARMLLIFWVRRFVQTFALAAAILGLIEWLSRGAEADYPTVLFWSGVAAVIAASLATRWLWRRGCRLPAASAQDFGTRR